ncbi:UNVERIFIED_CONTAM: hypothetical protein N8J90_04895 [Halobacillus marinus]
MFKRSILIISLLLLAACSSQDLGLQDLEEAHPDTFAEPIQALSDSQKERLGLPDKLPFDVSDVQASIDSSTVTIVYGSEKETEAAVHTIYEPGNILQESELQIPLNNGAVAGVQERNDTVFVEWYESDSDVIYQVEYNGTGEDRTEQAMNIANSI